MTRTAAEIERDLAARQADLEADVHLLDEMVHERLDVKRRVREAARRGAQEAVDLAIRVRESARERPGTALLVAAGLVLLVVGQLWARHAERVRRAERREQRQLAAPSTSTRSTSTRSTSTRSTSTRSTSTRSPSR